MFSPVLSGHSGFHPQYKDTQVRLNCDSILSRNVLVSVLVCLSGSALWQTGDLSRRYPAFTLHPLVAGICYSPPPIHPERRLSGNRKWMDKSLPLFRTLQSGRWSAVLLPSTSTGDGGMTTDQNLLRRGFNGTPARPLHCPVQAQLYSENNDKRVILNAELQHDDWRNYQSARLQAVF